ncbi:hypothetical protein ACSFBX_00005 [Variovorax sp. RB2P76]|uniref:hypothetical protein n=1 Tax=Variovorax sp. RB2P76 TaxID=3443736 RepID=UPI003F460B8F
MKKDAMVDKHLGAWGSIDADMKDGYRNGLSNAARASRGRGWNEERALAWARANGKLREIPDEGAAPLSQALHSMTKLPGHTHRL